MKRCIKVVDGIECHKFFEKEKKKYYCIGSIIVDKYIFVNEIQSITIMNIIPYLDGNYQVEEIEKKLQLKLNLNVDVRRLIAILDEGELLVSNNDYDNSNKKRFSEIEALFIPIKTFSLEKLNILFSKISRPDLLIVRIMVVSIILSLIMLSFIENKTFSLLSLLSEPKAIAYYILATIGSALLHEFSHVMVGVGYGLCPTTLTVATYAYVAPLVYVRLPGIYFLEVKKRIMIWSVGVMLNFTLLVLSYCLIFYTQNDLRLFLQTMVYSNLAIIIASINPLLYTDGYYLISTLLKKPNMRKSSFRVFLKIFSGDVKKEDVAYISYFILVAILLSCFVIPQILSTLVEFIGMTSNGLNIFETLKNCINVIAMLVFSLVAGLITLLKQCRLKMEKKDE